MTHSLRTRFLLLFGAIFLLGGATGYRFLVWYSDEVVNQLGTRLVERNALYGKSQILGILTREVTLAKKMASSPILKEWVANENDSRSRRQAIAELEDFRRFFHSRSYFFTIAGSGNYYYNNETDKTRGDHDPLKPRYTLSESIQKDGWFYATLRHVRDVQLNVDTDRHLGVTLVWINAVVHNAQGRAVAVTGSGVSLTEFIRSVIESRDEGVTNMLLSEDGAIQAHQDVSMIDFASARKADTKETRSTIFQLLDRPEDADILRDALARLVAGESTVEAVKLNIQGKSQLTGIAWVPEIQWFVVTMAHAQAVNATSHLPAMLPALTGALFIVLLAAAVFLQRTVLRRLYRLDEATRSLTAGHYEMQLEDNSRDEIGRLTRAFNAMTTHISTHTGKLEQQVAERTVALEHMAYTDYLTGCLNRRGMMARLEVEKNRLGRLNQQLGILLIDLDHFKQVNDKHGHAAGDIVLSGVAAILRDKVRTYDAVARWGGEEFLVGMFGIHHAEELEAIALKLLAEIRSASFAHGETQIRITVSGGAVLARPDEALDRILIEADNALYRAKNEGRDRLVMAR